MLNMRNSSQNRGGYDLGTAKVHIAENSFILLDRILQDGGLTVREAAELLQVDRSNAYRLLKSLESSGYVSHDKHCYMLGYKIDNLLNRELNPIQMIVAASPIMRNLASETGENVNLCVRVSDGMLFVHQEFSTMAIQVVKKFGAVEPFFCTASGRAVLAYLPEEYQNIILQNENRKQYTENTVTDVDTLKGLLKQYKKQGYAEEVEEFTPNIRCLSVPIISRFGWSRYSIGISYTVQSFSEKKNSFCEKLLKVGARQISESCDKLYISNEGDRSV